VFGSVGLLKMYFAVFLGLTMRFFSYYLVSVEMVFTWTLGTSVEQAAQPEDDRSLVLLYHLHSPTIPDQ
jgi:hypothetical protein